MGDLRTKRTLDPREGILYRTLDGPKVISTLNDVFRTRRIRRVELMDKISGLKGHDVSAWYSNRTIGSIGS
jgi:hypothetical protein